MKRNGKMSILNGLLLWLSLSLFVVGLIMVVANHLISGLPIQHQLEQTAKAACRDLALDLNTHVWNMDDESIREHFAGRSWVHHGYVFVDVLTEYDDVIVGVRFTDDKDTITHREEVHYEGNLVGFVEIELSRKQLHMMRRAVTRSGIMIVTIGIVVILLVATTLLTLILARPLHSTVDGLRRIAGGDYGHHLPEGRSAEVDVINREANSMADRIAQRERQLESEIRTREQAERELRSLAERLEEQVVERTQSLTEAYEQLQHECEERRHVQDEILSISNVEQNRIGRDLHDSLGQRLAGVSLMVAALERELRGGDRPEADTVTEIMGYLKDSIAQVRQIAYGLTPVDMAEGQLDVALDRLVADVDKTYGVHCTLERDGFSYIHDSAVAMHLYRITQEAIHNARVHGRAQNIEITFSCEDTGGELIVKDDGIGMSHDAMHDGMGLRIMRFRAESIGGELQVVSTEQGGTTLRTTFADRMPDQANSIS